MEDNKALESKERVKQFNKKVDDWNDRQLLGLNSIPFDEVCTDLIIPNSISNAPNVPTAITIFNNNESISIGLIDIPNHFDNTNTQEKFTANFQSFRNQFDTLLFRCPDANFTDFGFKEMVSSNEPSAITHYRNLSFDFESFKNVFKHNSIVIMKTATDSDSDSNRAMEAAATAFALPALYTNQIIELKNAIVCISTGACKSTDDEVNDIGKYSLNQIKRGATLTLDRMEDLTLQNEIKVSVLISGFDTKD